MPSVEFLIPPQRKDKPSGNLLLALKRAAKKAGDAVTETQEYEGLSDWLVLYGVGSKDGALARKRHVASGRRAILWDLGYFGRKKFGGFYRVSIDTDHPPAWINDTPLDGSRIIRHRVQMRSDADPYGHVVLAGLGRKSRRYLNAPDWEAEKLIDLRARFPNRRILFRPKPGWPALDLGCEVAEGPIEDVLRGASLAVCKHSNVAIDAIVAGVPFEAEDGAALALKEFSSMARMEFLQRLAWWNWHESEADQAWRFLQGRVCEIAKSSR